MPISLSDRQLTRQLVAEQNQKLLQRERRLVDGKPRAELGHVLERSSNAARALSPYARSC
jgi:hypothetical protein